MPKTVYKIRLKKGDTVVVRSGRHKGRSGKVLATHPTLNKVTVEGVNIVKRHTKPNRKHPQGGIIEITQPIWVGKVGLLDPTTKKPVRIGYRLGNQKAKTRVIAKSGKELK